MFEKRGVLIDRLSQTITRQGARRSRNDEVAMSKENSSTGFSPFPRGILTSCCSAESICSLAEDVCRTSDRCAWGPSAETPSWRNVPAAPTRSRCTQGRPSCGSSPQVSYVAASFSLRSIDELLPSRRRPLTNCAFSQTLSPFSASLPARRSSPCSPLPARPLHLYQRHRSPVRARLPMPAPFSHHPTPRVVSLRRDPSSHSGEHRADPSRPSVLYVALAFGVSRCAVSWFVARDRSRESCAVFPRRQHPDLCRRQRWVHQRSKLHRHAF